MSKGPPYFIVRMTAVFLQKGTPTFFQHEATARHGLRIFLVLRGFGWSSSDAVSRFVVNSALRLIGARRPVWWEGQREYTEETATKIGRDRCLSCGRILPDRHVKFCSKKCNAIWRVAIGDLDRREKELKRKRQYWQAVRAASELRLCERCEKPFRPVGDQRFCSRVCAGKRSVKEKMNGHHHPWMTKTGGAVASVVENSSANTRTGTEGSARGNARTRITTSSQPTHEPRPEAH